MDNVNPKHNLPVISADDFNLDPLRYELRNGNEEDAPSCPFGNRYEWIGYDNQKNRYVRFTKSVFKRLVQKK